MPQGPRRFGPVGESVHGSSIAESHCHLLFFGDQTFDLPLHPVDRSLRRPPARFRGVAGEATAKNDRSRLGKDCDMSTECACRDLQYRCLPGAWTAGHCHQPDLVIGENTMAGNRPVAESGGGVLRQLVRHQPNFTPRHQEGCYDTRS